ncbi:transpeptidase [Corynebacterium heidelbergense]|uniref:Transpeptidase n=1 Tax=Corynebacterium heidelbergense TaxID=2055947 RepID=A0A364V7U2_9CORY|nr:transpeptidase [Corynebacterium heidelbergense]
MPLTGPRQHPTSRANQRRLALRRRQTPAAEGESASGVSVSGASVSGVSVSGTQADSARAQRAQARKTHARKAPAVTIAALLATSGLLAGCTVGDNGQDNSGNASSSAKPGDEAGSIKANVKDKAKAADVNEPVTVTADEKLDSVKLTNDAGQDVAGTYNQDHTKWTANEKLGFGRQYKLAVKAGEHKLNNSFTTVSPDYQVSSSLAPVEGATVGVGQVIAIRFDSVIEDRKAAEKAIKIETDPQVEGAFYWINGQEVRWRPKEYWKPGTKVKIKANLYGTKLGDGMYGDEDLSANFTIGDDVRAIVDNNSKTMKIYRNGNLLQTMPVSLGTDGGRWATPNGIYRVGEQNESLIMDSATFGLPQSQGGYRTPVQFATQLSYSGIYIHAAPWSVWAQGSQNTSHGCVNVSTQDAQWVFNNMKRGDIVEIKNTTGGQLDGTDGLGDWNIDWATWTKGNPAQ